MQEYDKSSKWLIQHHGDSILRLAGVRDIVDWHPLQAEVVQPRRLPDGLIEVHRRGRDEASFRAGDFHLPLRQAGRAGRPRHAPGLPRPRDRARGPGAGLAPAREPAPSGPRRCQSYEGSTAFGRWRVVELWTIPAEDLLAAGDVGLIPWVPLSSIRRPARGDLPPVPRAHRPGRAARRARKPARCRPVPGRAAV